MESPSTHDEDEDDDMNDLYSIAHNAKKLFSIIHDAEHYIADCYALFERIMDLGIKELYYREDPDDEFQNRMKAQNEIIEEIENSGSRKGSQKDDDSESNRMKKIRILK